MFNCLLIIEIGIIMSELNVLPVNVSQNIELKDESASFNSTMSKGDFSQFIDLHLNKNKEAESNNKLDNAISEADGDKKSSLATESNHKSKESDDLVENSDTSNESDSVTLVQKPAVSGKKGQEKSNEIDQKALIESEQLMSFLTKADNTLINPPVDASFSSAEKLSVEQKAQYEAQLLLNSSNLVADLSAVAQALGKEQVDATLAPILSEEIGSAEELPDQASSAKELLLSHVDPVAVVKSAELKNDLKTEIKLTNINSDKMNGDVTLTAEQTIVKQEKINNVQVSNDKINKNVLQKELLQSRETGELTQSQLSENENENENENKQISANVVTQHSKNNQVQSDVVKPIEDSVDSIEKQVATSKEIQHSSNNQVQPDKVKSIENSVDAIEKQVNTSKKTQHDKSSNLLNAQLTKSELSQNSEVTSANEKANQAAVDIKKTALPNNQITTHSVSNDDANKAQVKQDEKAQLSASFTEQSQQKAVAQNDGEVFIEGKPIASVKIETRPNGHFIDVSGNATQTPEHIIEQQSAEMLNPSVATEVTQNQKTNVQLHQETISLFRKDFNEAVKDKVMLMISQKLQQFDITLDPPELGNMQVRVNLQGEQAVVNFLVQSQQTKDALEQNMHKLRELLAEQGVDVGDANVEQQSQQSANEEGSPAEKNSHMNGNLDSIDDANDVVAHTLSAQMIDSSTASIDYYA